MSKTAKITKAKLKDGLFLEVEYTEEVVVKGNVTGTRTVGETLTVPVHEDLIKAFKPLAGHLAMVCDEVPAKKLADVIDKYRANGFSLKGEDASSGITIMGGKTSKHGFFTLNTPFQRFETSSYAGISELAIVIETCKHEVLEYLFNGKKAPDLQIDMFDTNAPGNHDADHDNQDGLEELGNASNKGKNKGSKKMRVVKNADDEHAHLEETAAPEKPKRSRGKKKDAGEF